MNQPVGKNNACLLSGIFIFAKNSRQLLIAMLWYASLLLAARCPELPSRMKSIALLLQEYQPRLRDILCLLPFRQPVSQVVRQVETFAHQLSTAS
jgi:hypothetical protein